MSLSLQADKTRALLVKHCNDYPDLQPQDIFKFLFQSAFGCEHLASNADFVLNYIVDEYQRVGKNIAPLIEPLDGAYCRVHLSCLNAGLTAQTLAKLFLLSAKKEPNGLNLLEEKLQITKQLISDGTLKIDAALFDKSLDTWHDLGYPAVRHSDIFRNEYKPAYRVITDLYAHFLDIFTQIDRLKDNKKVIIAIEGGSASGKTTLAGILAKIYDAAVIHMDDFFLRQTQRTPSRLQEVGGNVDRERFIEEVLTPLSQNRVVTYSPFDCSKMALSEPVTVPDRRVTIVEGVYSTHPAFGKYYDLAIFLDIDKGFQRSRILKRNGLELSNRFFNEWIPLEDVYFDKTQIKSRCYNKIIKN